MLLIPAIHREDLLATRVAGLTLAERLYHHGRKAGMDRILITVAEDSELWSIPILKSCLAPNYSDTHCANIDRCIVCKPGILPDIECLKWLSQVEIKQDELLEFQGLFIFKPSGQGFELQRAFEHDGYSSLLEFLRTHLLEKTNACENGRIFDLTIDANVARVEKILFRSLIKSTEGFMSRHVERRISLAISRRLVNTPTTPNQITLLSILIGLAGAWCISLGTGLLQVTGALLFLLHSIVDGCDGEIARIKFMESRLGGILDFWGDNIVHAAIFTAIGVAWHNRTGSILPIMLSGVAVAGTFLSALLIYLSTMRKKASEEGPLYTSVASSPSNARIVKVADFLSRRDFIYLVVILAFYRHLDWFLVASAIGTMAFLAMLIWIRHKGQPG